MLNRTLQKNNDVLWKLCATAFIICDTVFIFIIHYLPVWKYNGDWQASEILFSYKYGFIKRGFLGTLFEIVAKVFNVSDKVKLLSLFQFAGEMIFTAMVFLLILYMIIKVRGAEATRGVLFIAVLFSLLGGIGFFYYDWGALDTFFVSLTAAAVFAILFDRLLWIIPLISSICVMIHEGYVLMYFSIIFALLFYRMSAQTDKKKKKYYFSVLLITTAFSAALFFYFYFFSKVDDTYTASMVIADIKAVIGSNAQDFNIEYILFDGQAPGGVLDAKTLFSAALGVRLKKLFVQLLPFLPLVIFCLSFWIHQIKNAVGFKNKFVKFVCGFTEVVAVPLFIVHADLSRWANAVYFYEFVMMSVLLIDGDSDATDFFKKLRVFKNPIYTELFIIYVALLEFPPFYNKYSFSLVSALLEVSILM